jgi:hypothetical protein
VAGFASPVIGVWLELVAADVIGVPRRRKSVFRAVAIDGTCGAGSCGAVAIGIGALRGVSTHTVTKRAAANV